MCMFFTILCGFDFQVFTVADSIPVNTYLFFKNFEVFLLQI